MTRLKKAARDAGLPFGERRMTYNSRLAQELGKWAELRGKGEGFNRAVFQAYFVQGKNIGNVEELVGLSRDLGLPGEEARKVMERRDFKEAVDQDWIRSQQLGIRAVPTFLMGSQVLVGAQPYEKLVELLTAAKVKKRQDKP
jgi:predicted DsbA family dithiol-disulfide isomerase